MSKTKSTAKQITYGSLFSGVGGFDLGFDRTGMVCSFQVEINKFCLQVLQNHWPDTLRLEDVRNVGKERVPAVDLLCGGFPCQDVSVAGRRAGLSGERSGLWSEFARIAGELRPRWVVIENVPGLLSSHQGRDFGQILGTLDEFGYGVAWRILDSQNFGVAQRRRRLFIVGSLGDLSAAEVLFERGGMSGDSSQSRKAGEGAVGEGDRGTRGPYWDGGELSDTLDVSMIGKGQMMPEKRRFPTVFTDAFADQWKDTEQANTLQGKNRTPKSETFVYDMAHADSVIRETEDAPTLQSRMGTGGNQVPMVLSFNGVQITSKTNRSRPVEEKTSTLDSHGQMMVAQTLCTNPYNNSDPSMDGTMHIQDGSSLLRRLTPLECERLQGFPDHWTEGCSDTQRYRQMGNAVTVTVVEWLGRRILEVHNKGDKP